MGGVSSERDVSIMTGNEMIAQLDQNKYDVQPVVLDNKTDLIEKAKDLDIALLALHGKFGEDGTIQGALETLGIPYTGCGVLSSSLCMDKDITKRLCRFAGVLTAEWLMLKQADDLSVDDIMRRLGMPVVVKPNLGGSSIGVKIARDRQALASAIQEALKYDDEVMIEQYVDGDEITCAILNGTMLPVVSIQYDADFFDYTQKYDDNGALEQIIELPDAVHKRVEEAALACYQALKCSVYARVDMILRDGRPYVVEVNTLPGLTKNSLLPKSAQAAGIPYSQLLDILIEQSLKEKRS